ncbi:MAG: rRNA maturation RNase YbeY [Firmicutes bacterium]|nr:rRNA maturation RNase YbeY [Bacillota bacterium]
MEIHINNQQNKVPFGDFESLIQKVVIATLELEEVDLEVEVSITFVDNEYIQDLNKQYRDKDYPTDVLSFPQMDDDFPGIEPVLGDIVISLEKALEQSGEYGHSMEREVGYLVAHGMLHLLGYDHENEDERNLMRNKEECIMAMVGLERLGRRE